MAYGGLVFHLFGAPCVVPGTRNSRFFFLIPFKTSRIHSLALKSPLSCTCESNQISLPGFCRLSFGGFCPCFFLLNLQSQRFDFRFRQGFSAGEDLVIETRQRREQARESGNINSQSIEYGRDICRRKIEVNRFFKGGKDPYGQEGEKNPIH